MEEEQRVCAEFSCGCLCSAAYVACRAGPSSFLWGIMDVEPKQPPPDKRLSRFEIGACGGGRQLQGRLHPHQGYVFLDRLTDGSEVITHTITLKQQVLPELKNPHELVWLEDNDGLGCVVGYGNYPDPPQTLFFYRSGWTGSCTLELMIVCMWLR